MSEVIVLLVLTLFFWGILYLYLKALLKLKNPHSTNSKILSGFMWLTLILMVVVFYMIGIHFIENGSFLVEKSWAISPVGLGFILSLFLNKADWKIFNQRFGAKNRDS